MRICLLRKFNKMSIFEEFQNLRKIFVSWFLIFIILFIFFFGFNIKNVSFQIFGRIFHFNIPLPTYDSFSVQFFKKVRKDFLPREMEIITLNPLDALWGQIGISLFLAFVFSLPFLIYNLANFSWPALKKVEKKAILEIFFPSLFLFLLGCFFGYYLLVPLTFKIVYSFVKTLEIKPFFSFRDSISLFLTLLFISGAIFVFPVFMFLGAKFNLIQPDFWRKNWRYATLIFLGFSAIITPDGTGVTMVLLSLPLIFLYWLGYIISKRSKIF